MKHVNPAKFLRKVYTEQGGVKEYNYNQQAIGALKFIGFLFACKIVKFGIDTVSSMPIKALKKDEDKSC